MIGTPSFKIHLPNRNFLSPEPPMRYREPYRSQLSERIISGKFTYTRRVVAHASAARDDLHTLSYTCSTMSKKPGSQLHRGRLASAGGTVREVSIVPRLSVVLCERAPTPAFRPGQAFLTSGASGTTEESGTSRGTAGD